MKDFSPYRNSLNYAAALLLSLSVSGFFLGAPVMMLHPNVTRDQATFETPDSAADAFVDAVARRDHAKLERVLGRDFERFIPAKRIAERSVYAFLGAWSQQHRVVMRDAGRGAPAARADVRVGRTGWTLPIPLVKSREGWRFDTAATPASFERCPGNA